MRYRRLGTTKVLGRDLPAASTLRARLLGLAFCDVEAAGPGLLIPRCRSIHTFGMRFYLDLVFLDGEGNPVARHGAVGPRRIVTCRRAVAVAEFVSGAGGEGWRAQP